MRAWVKAAAMAAGLGVLSCGCLEEDLGRSDEGQGPLDYPAAEIIEMELAAALNESSLMPAKGSA